MTFGGLMTGCGLLGLGDDPEVPGAVEDFMGTGVGGPFPCEVVGEPVRLATAQDPRGGANFEWWAAETAGGGKSDVVIQIDDDGNSVGGGGGGCGNEPSPGEDDGLWWSGGGGSDSEVVHGGHVPDDAVAARLTFENGESVTVDANERGYFLVILAESACCEWSFVELLEALDEHGDVIGSE